MTKSAARVLLLVLVGLLAVSMAWSSGQGEAAKPGERVKITMFMGNSGVAQPAGVDPSDNWLINIVEKYANVDLELEIPNYTDFATKCNLLLASGNLPDIVHSWIIADMVKAADAGAFLDLKAYYDKSPQMQKVCPPLNFEITRSGTTTGRYWAIPMNAVGMEPGWGIIVNQNLINQYNDGKYPEDVQGYLDWFKKIKAGIPDSIPYASRVSGNNLFVNSASIFAMYGGYPMWTSWKNGKLVRNIEIPEMREAVAVYRQMYKDGILDKEFATNPPDAYFQKLANKSVATQTNSIDQLVPGVGTVLEAAKKAGTPFIEWVFAPALKRYPPGVDAKFISLQSMDVFPINTAHRTAISAKTKYPAQAWKVLEGFASDELRDAQAWGREGKEYNVVGGKRVPTGRLYFNDINDPDSHYWTLHTGIIWGFWPTEVKYEVQRLKAPAEFQRAYDSSRWLVANGKANGLAPGNFLPTMPEINAKAGEADAAIAQMMAKTISGEATMDDFDAMLKDWKQKYGFMTEMQTKWINDNSAALKSKGVKVLGM
jgi:ABC-type glycerol-3-phosphate transport system substrate-binding protein